MSVETATLDDWPAIEALVVASRLPVAGLADHFPDAYAVVRRAGQVIGVAGLQPYGRFGLLRSVAVGEGHRNGGIGRTLVSERLAGARAAGLDGVYLLTTGASEWFLRMGFERVARKAAPPELLASPEFIDACPASADCLFARTSGQTQVSPSRVRA